jgi:hypothetical protein
MDARLETFRLPRAVKLVLPAMDNRTVRQALRENLVSFPAQIPIFEKLCRPDLQRHAVLLYFVRGWTMKDLAARFGLARQRMGQILTAWRVRAVKEGYIEAIDADHPLFKRTPARSVHSNSVPSAERQSDDAAARQAIVDVLENQLRLCAKALNGNGDSCELLLERAKVLCARLESDAMPATRERRTTVVLSAAKEMFSRVSSSVQEYRSAG